MLTVHSIDLDEIGRCYIGALADEIAKRDDIEEDANDEPANG